MDVILQNEKLKIQTNTHGGEIKSIIGKKSKNEYLWRGIPFWWKIYCPTLFPVIGKVKNYHYKSNGESFFMPQHGFAAKAKHTLLQKNDTMVKYQLKNNEEINKIYPFNFSLITMYELDDNKITISFEVNNLDTKDMYFSIGSHPAFKCPMYGEKDELKDYYLEFSEIENTTKKEINKDDFLTGKDIDYLHDTNILKISQETFLDGTIIMDKLKSKYVTLKSNKHNRSIKVNFENFNIFSIWGPDRNATFVCLEPWNGHADIEGFEEDIKNKKWNIQLKPGKVYKTSYSIEISE